MPDVLDTGAAAIVVEHPTGDGRPAARPPIGRVLTRTGAMQRHRLGLELERVMLHDHVLRNS